LAVNTWIAASAGNASTDANWSLGHAPLTGEDVVFDATSVNNCAWDIPATIVPNSITLATGYSGTVTQGAVDMSIGAGGYAQAAGTFTALGAKTITLAGSLTHTGGTFTLSVANLISTGTGVTISTVEAGGGFAHLRVSGSATVTSAGTSQTCYTLTVDSGASLAIATGKTLQAKYFAGRTFNNAGTIAGPGTLKVSLYDVEMSVTFGTVTAPVIVEAYSSATANRTLTLGANTVLGSSLTVQSAHASYTMTLASGNYTLSVAGAVTLGARGVLSQGTGQWSFGSYTQSGASSVFTQGGPVSVSGDTVISDGTLTGDPTKTWTCGGNFTQTGEPTIPNGKLALVMSGTATLANSASIQIRSLCINGNVIHSATDPANQLTILAGGLTVSNGASFVANKGVIIRYYDNTYAGLINNGRISGSGAITIYLRYAVLPLCPGAVDAPLSLLAISESTANVGVSMTCSWALGSTLFVQSAHASNTLTLDLAGHSLTARGITIGTRGVLLGGEGVIRNYGNFDSSAGTWTPETCQYVQAAAGSIKTAAGHSFNDLIVESKAAGSSLLSNVTVNGIYAHVPELATGAFTLTKNGPEYTGRRRPLRKLIKKKMVWESLADMLLLEDIERVSA
jgi:hypothetical protein